MIATVDLEESQLLKSYIYTKWRGLSGRCTSCKEMTEVLYPCCYGAVEFEGSLFDADALWDKIENELIKRSEPDYDAIRKDLALEGQV